MVGAGRGPVHPPRATDPAFTPAAREGVMGLKPCTITYTYVRTYTRNAHTYTY